MCEPISIAVAGVAVAAGSAYMAQSNQKAAANKQAHDANAAGLKQSSAEYANQEATMRWQDDNWQQDIDFANQTVDFQEQQFKQQADYVARAGTAIVQNENAALAQVALKSVQQNIATTLGEVDNNSKAAISAASARASADSRGATGNSVDAIIDDVHRQNGQAIDVMEMNRTAGMSQTMTDLQATKAAGDSQLGTLQGSVKSFSPSTPIRTPQPVGTVQSPTLVSAAPRSALGDALAVGGAGIQGGLQGINLYNTVQGQTMQQTATQIKTTLGINP